VTLENMQGDTKTYHWSPKPEGSFSRPNGPSGVTGPADPNIQLINLKSEWKPFQIVSPEGVSADIYNGENTYFSFECWNHWPVAQIPSSGRPCVAADRSSHTSLSHLIWKVYSADESTKSKIMMSGLTTKTPADLLPLAKSWLSPPNMHVTGAGYQDGSYDAAQRAYVVTKTAADAPAVLKLTFDATPASPLYDPAIVIKGWGLGAARLEEDGKSVSWDKNYRVGHIHGLREDDLVIWIQRQSTETLHIQIVPATRSPKSHERIQQRQAVEPE